MGIRDWLYHRHYWSIPHRRESDQRVVQVCYECGKEREVQVDLKINGDREKTEKKKPAGDTGIVPHD